MNIPFKKGQRVYVVDERELYHYEKRDLGYDHLGWLGDRDVKVTDGYEYYVKKESFYFGLLDEYDPSEIFTNEADAEKHRDELIHQKKNKSYNDILETAPRCTGEILPIQNGDFRFFWYPNLPGDIRLLTVWHQDGTISARAILPLKSERKPLIKLTLSKAEEAYLRREMERHCRELTIGGTLSELSDYYRPMEGER